MKFLAIIPARYASTRFPGKPLVDINGKPMIQWVFENTSKAIEDVYVATDDERIEKAVLSFGGNVVMTSPDHPSGTDRCAEAARKVEEITGKTFDAVINIQGDEPCVDPDQICELKNCFSSKTELATLVTRVDSLEHLLSPSSAKVVLDKDSNAILFSRSPIPFVRGTEQKDWLTKHKFIRHVGMYGYRRDILDVITKLEPSPLEKAESLEQLRWVENGFKITCGFTQIQGVGVDTPEDLKKVLKNLTS